MHFWKFILSFLIVKILWIEAIKLRDLTVNTSSGCVQGFYLKSFNNEFIGFEGIPFAEPLTGNSRFKVIVLVKIIIFLFINLYC